MAAVYRAYGVEAQWTPTGGAMVEGITVRRDTFDKEVGYGDSESVLRCHLIHVRVSEIAVARKDDLVRTVAGLQRVMAKPKLTEDGLEWLCEVTAPEP